VLKGIFKYLILLVISLGYLQAMAEVNTETIKNTWRDEYDSYVQNKNSTEHHLKLKKQNSEPTLLTKQLTLPTKPLSYSLFSSTGYQSLVINSFGLFLLHSKLLI